MAWFTQLGLESGTTGLEFVGSKVPNMAVVNGTDISSLLQRGLPFESRCKPSFLMVDRDFV